MLHNSTAFQSRIPLQSTNFQFVEKFSCARSEMKEIKKLIKSIFPRDSTLHSNFFVPSLVAHRRAPGRNRESSGAYSCLQRKRRATLSSARSRSSDSNDNSNRFSCVGDRLPRNVDYKVETEGNYGFFIYTESERGRVDGRTMREKMD